jgi:glycosyltransferase involved in cell wall biosynthesis
MDSISETAGHRTSSRNNRPLVLLVCTGLGGISRGFETYMHQLANALGKSDHLPFQFLTLSAYPNENAAYTHKKLPAISRNNKVLGKLTKDLHKRFHIEQQTLFFPIVAYVILKKPKLIYLGEYQLYCYLYKIRQILGIDFSLCLHTGGQAMPGLFQSGKDWVHHITNRFWESCMKRGIPENRMFLIPHPLEITTISIAKNPSLLMGARDKKIILCVGSIDEKIKGVLTLAKAIAPYSTTIFPVFLGEATPDTHVLNAYLKRYFGENFFIGKVGQTELQNWYANADLLVSASKAESFGLVILESLLQGTPAICFKWPAAEWVFQGHCSYFTSMHPQEMGVQIMELVNRQDAVIDRENRTKFVRDTYGWNQLLPQYETMFRKMVTAI